MPENSNMMYGFNSFTLQMNLLNDVLREKLPPSDSRFRPDVQLWEEGKQEEASDEKNRLENNQRARKKLLKETIGDKMEPDNDSSWYSPKYFSKTKNPITGDEMYEYCASNSR